MRAKCIYLLPCSNLFILVAIGRITCYFYIEGRSYDIKFNGTELLRMLKASKILGLFKQSSRSAFLLPSSYLFILLFLHTRVYDNAIKVHKCLEWGKQLGFSEFTRNASAWYSDLLILLNKKKNDVNKQKVPSY